MADENTSAPAPDDELVITLVRKTRKVRVTDENGLTTRMTLKEMTGANRDKYVQKQAARAKTSADGKTSWITNFDNIQVDLIERCLFDENEKPVPAMVIAQYPASVQVALFKACGELNSLDMASEEKEKNS